MQDLAFFVLDLGAFRRQALAVMLTGRLTIVMVASGINKNHQYSPSDEE